MGELVPGSKVAGYRIESLVGRGGMGVVYRAVQLRLERVVALKVIAPELLDDEDVRARFLAEARAAASVDHPNVIPVHEAGEDDGVAFIAMRYVAGADLRSRVRHGGALDPAEAAGFVVQAAAALDAIHRAGFVHRDVKPANLLVDPNGHVYLTDFGLAKQIITHSGATRTGHWVGTLDYVAPEQIRGGRIDARADVYALGGVLHYTLTGRVPFEREGDEAKLWAQLSAPPPAPSQLRRGLRPDFDGVVARAMAKEADHRFPSAGDLGRAAHAAAVGAVPSEPERVVARGAAAPGAAPVEPGLAAEAETNTAQAGPIGRAPGELVPAAPRRRRPRLLAAGVIAIGMVAVAIGAWSLRDEPRTRSTAATTTPTAAPTVKATPTAVASVAQTIANVNDRPNGIVLADGDLWLSSARQPYLTRVDPVTGKERKRHPKTDAEINAMVSYRDDVWVAVAATREVLRFDGRTGKLRKRLKLPARPRRLAVANSGVWVATEPEIGGPGELLRYDHDGRLMQPTLVVNEGIGGLIAADGAIWVVKDRTHKLARMRPDADVLTDWATLSSPAQSLRFGDDALWVTLDGEDEIARISADGRSQRTTATGHAPSQSVIAGGRLFVANRNDNTVLVFDPNTLKRIGEPIDVGFNPYAMVADDRSVWVTGLGDNTLTRIDYR